MAHPLDCRGGVVARKYQPSVAPGYWTLGCGWLNGGWDISNLVMFGGHCFLPHEWRFDSASPKVVWRPKGHDFDSATRGLICWQFTHVVVWLVVSNMFIFHHIWDNPSHNPSHRWLKNVKTTNQFFFTYAKPSFRTPRPLGTVPTHQVFQVPRAPWPPAPAGLAPRCRMPRRNHQSCQRFRFQQRWPRRWY